ncbi:hypothetical protein [Bacillus sp. Hm123]|uniref:hypothetical protein n=1 Tax=Bacillus sp. Hm123 TaxID=3450745 RepID=UPI003F42A294
MTIKDMVDILIALFGMMATVGAAGAAFYSAYLARKSIERQEDQYKKSLEPLIVPKMKNYTFTLDYMKPSFHFFNWITQDTDLEEQEFKLPLVNVSKGIAKEVKINLEFTNYKKIIKYITDSELNEKIHIKLGEDLWGANKEMITVCTEGNAGTYQVTDFPQQETLYISGEGDDSAFTIKFPPVFMALGNVYMYCKIFGSKSSAISPCFKIKIMCKDLAGNAHNFNYLLSISDDSFIIAKRSPGHDLLGSTTLYFHLNRI